MVMLVFFNWYFFNLWNWLQSVGLAYKQPLENTLTIRSMATNKRNCNLNLCSLTADRPNSVTQTQSRILIPSQLGYM